MGKSGLRQIGDICGKATIFDQNEEMNSLFPVGNPTTYTMLALGSPFIYITQSVTEVWMMLFWSPVA